MALEVRTTEERIAHIEGILEQMNERIRNDEVGLHHLREEMKGEFQGVDAKFQGVEGKIDGLQKEMREQFRWMIGMWLSVILAILATIITIILKG